MTTKNRAPSSTATALIDAAKALADDVDALTFTTPAAYVMNPLRYAWAMHAAYLTRFGSTTKRTLFLGMNPGPYGMVQTGVPFGAVSVVREWLRLDEKITSPDVAHPKRPIEGLLTTREEVSGARLWGLFRARFMTTDAFFAEHIVMNWCPLAFLDEGGRNVTPDKLAKGERQPLESACDAHLARIIDAIAPEFVVGVGKFAEARARVVVESGATRARPTITTILHPSPASPLANKGFEAEAVRALVDAGVWSP